MEYVLIRQSLFVWINCSDELSVVNCTVYNNNTVFPLIMAPGAKTNFWGVPDLEIWNFQF